MALLTSTALSGLRARLRTPEERDLAIRVSSLLWLIGSVAALLMLAVPGGHVSGPGAVVVTSLAGLAWAAATLRAPRMPRWSTAIPYVSMGLAMAAVAVLAAASGGDDSPVVAYLWLVVVYTAFFFAPAEALAYWIGCTGARALPLLYTDVAVHEDNLLRDLVVAGPIYVAAGAFIMAGRALLSGASTRAVAAEQVQHELADEQSSLRRVATAVAAGSPPQAIMALVASEAGRLLGADGAAIVAFERTDRVSVRGFWTGAGEPVVPQEADANLELRPGDEMLELRDAPGVVRHDDYPADHPSRAFAMGFRSFLAAPVHTDNALWGGLVVVCRRPGAFSSCAEERLQDFAGLISTAVVNAEDRARLDTHAAIDALTRLPNSRAFAERLDQEISRARRHGRPLALAIADVDGFKALNDRAGTEVGDLVLNEIAGSLRACVRDEDVIARLADDDFAILFVESDREEAFAAVERSRAHVASTTFRHGLRVTLSVGFCDLASVDASADLFGAASAALAHAKAHGPDRSWIYDPAVVRELDEQARTEVLDRTQALMGLRALARTVDAKDAATMEHSERVAALAARLAAELGWSERDVARMREAALLHDVGKVGVPDDVLLKPGRLEPHEFATVREHAALGARIVAGVLDSGQASWIGRHHERPDGEGYPLGLRAEELDDGAAVLAVAEAWDSMTRESWYAGAKAVDASLAECRALAGRQFTPAAVGALEILGSRGELTLAATRVHRPTDLGAVSDA